MRDRQKKNIEKRREVMGFEDIYQTSKDNGGTGVCVCMLTLQCICTHKNTLRLMYYDCQL